MHVALFGGSFNPPHIGHIFAALYALKTAQPDEIWVLPSFSHPLHKQLIDAEHRLAMCRLAFAGIEHIHVRDDERTNSTGYTWDLIHNLKSQYPHHRFSLIGGTDTQESLTTWYRGEELATLISVIAVPRGGYDASPAALPSISSSLIRERIATQQDITELVDAQVHAYICEQKVYI